MRPEIASLILSACLIVTALCLVTIIVWPLTTTGAAVFTATIVTAVIVGYYASNHL